MEFEVFVPARRVEERQVLDRPLQSSSCHTRKTYGVSVRASLEPRQNVERRPKAGIS